MTAQFALLLAVAAPWIAAAAIFALGESRNTARTVIGLVAAVLATTSAVVLGVHVASGAQAVSVGIPLLGTRFALATDGVGVLFAVVAAVLWLVTTVYATGYMAHGADRARFFGFFAICVGSAIGIALSANLLTLFVFYEALTLATYPLVAHTGTSAAIRGGRTYLYYALTGGTVLAIGVVWLYAIGGGADFAAGGSLPASLVAGAGPQLTVVFALLIAGFGVKAALFPAHGWLPAAMVAPAPVSALLHAVAVVKAGVFGIARVVLDVYGTDTASALGVLLPLAALAAFTIIFASVRALSQDDIKKRLAYSTIGQLSYIVLGLAIGTPVAAAAAVAHLAHHAFLKITMFFTAGTLAEELKVYRVSEMDGVGRRMPLTMTAFSVAALGIIGIPPAAGFVSKWGLGLGGLEAGSVWPLAVLAVSSILNAAYLLPMIGRAWFGTPRPEWLRSDRLPGESRRFESDHRLVWPLVLTAGVGLASGIFAAVSWAPASWAAVATGASARLVIPWRPALAGLDVPGAFFLVLAVVIWLAAFVSSWNAEGHDRIRYRTFLVLSASGSIALAFATDAALFYAAFSVMALAAYGLIVHGGTPEQRRAGRIYLAFTIVAEALLLSALLIGSLGDGLIAQTLASSPWRDGAIALLLLAFGIKIGAIGLHGWMPGAYGAASPGAGAAIAGVASSAGILGLVRFLPGEAGGLGSWGAAVMTAGIAAAVYGAVIGTLQRNPRHVLAYSSMSQFGLMTVGVGAGLTSAEAWPVAVSAMAIYLTHHGFAKAALFLTVDASEAGADRRVVRIGAVVAGLSLAGLPLTSGAIAKVALKGVAGMATAPWASALETLLPIAAVGTTVLVARFAFLVWYQPRVVGDTGSSAGSPAPGSAVTRVRLLVLVAAIAFVVGLLWLISFEPVSYAAHKSLTQAYLWALTWPVLTGVALAAVVWFVRPAAVLRLAGRVAPGDVWARPLAVLDEAFITRKSEARVEEKQEPQTDGARLQVFARAERWLLSWSVAAAGAALLALILQTLAG